MRASPPRIEQLDAVRAGAFLAVFGFHAAHLPFGYCGVDLFFVLSGFLITRNLLALRGHATTRSAFTTFFSHRLLRIVPPYYLAILLVIAVQPIAARELPWYFGFASNVRDAIRPTLEGPLCTFWSIAVEEQFYLVWPFLVLLLPRRALGPAFVAAIVGAALCRFVLSGNDDAVYRLTISRMDALAAGSLLALVEARRFAAKYYLALGIAAVLGFVAFSVATPDFHYYRANVLYDVFGYALVTAIATSVIALACRVPAGLRDAMCHPVLRYIGKISYVAYLVHALVLETVARLALPTLVRIPLALAITLGLATASWVFLERPLQRLKSRVAIERKPRRLPTTVPTIVPA